MKKKSSHRKEILVLHPTDSTGEILQQPCQLALLLHTQAEAAAVPGEGGQSHELQPSEVGARLCSGPLGDAVTMRWDRHGLEGVLLLPPSAEIC